jgi:hypothetical protein
MKLTANAHEFDEVLQLDVHPLQSHTHGHKDSGAGQK